MASKWFTICAALVLFVPFIKTAKYEAVFEGVLAFRTTSGLYLLTTEQTAGRCAFRCTKDPICMAFNFNSGNKACELTTDNGNAVNNTGIGLDTNWEHYYVNPDNCADREPFVNPCDLSSTSYACGTGTCSAPDSCTRTLNFVSGLPAIAHLCQCSLFSSGANCELNPQTVSVGLRAYTISDSALNASSETDVGKVGHGRLDYTNDNALQMGWEASPTDTDPFYMVDLGNIHLVGGVTTQGAMRKNMVVRGWVTSYQLSFSADNSMYVAFYNNETFSGNTDATSHKTHTFTQPVLAQYVKIHPMTWQTVCAMRLELYARVDKANTDFTSCGAWMVAGATIAWQYLIDRDGHNNGTSPFWVRCAFDRPEQVAETVFQHDHYNASEVFVPSLCDTHLCYKTEEFIYENTLPEITSIVDSSIWCEMTFRTSCYGSVASRTGWYNRAGTAKYYIGPHGKDARGSSYKCSCWYSNTCSHTYCNCESNDAAWRYDDGTLTYKPDLPMTKLGFGDIDDNGAIGGRKYKLSHLHCYGRKEIDNPSAFEVLETKETTYSGYLFLAVRIRLPSDGKCKTGDCCRDYQRLCQYLGNWRPTGCSQPHVGTNWPRKKCYAEYGSDQDINDALGCSPNSKIAAVVNQAFGISLATGSNSFGFHVCDGYCSSTLAASATSLSYTSAALSAADKIAYTVCRPA